ncbi:protein of unknown function DUF29 [Synechococcus sp. PCC 7502]|uniref:DUF29 domain-containing protein n=1 Tax=Synechococcus sp. PCC 7502 TaxID=1173263 RepID=UPI00029F871A|nr:DUF29 domain-containing protein [Synechococcus sp. PCC 7502]AFY73752.1 protein of unknown function DUF29 [Synechococcus sp. PCC 7502]
MSTNLLTSLYNLDYQQWLETTIINLSDRNFGQINLEDLVAELESMGKSEKSALESNLVILLMHLLKYKYQPQKQSDSWRRSIVEHRRRILISFKHSPSLKKYFEQVFDECYIDARQDAKTETQLPLVTFPEVCDFSKEQVLDPDFLP